MPRSCSTTTLAGELYPLAMDARSFWDGIAQWFGYDVWDWGSAADWVAGVGTVATFVIAGRVLQIQARDKKRQLADLFLTHVRIRKREDGFQEFVIRGHNLGETRIYNPVLYYYEWDGERATGPLWPIDDKQLSILPKAYGTSRTSRPLHPFAPSPTFRFVDSNGRVWLRSGWSGRYISRFSFEAFHNLRRVGRAYARFVIWLSYGLPGKGKHRTQSW